MTTNEQDCAADERFERLLLDSARADEVPSNVDAAWQRFDSALKGVSLLAAGAGGALAVRKAQRWFAVKWLIWGVLTGSALTALSLRALRDRRAETSPSVSIPVAVPAAASPTPRAMLEPAAPPTTAEAAPASKPARPSTRSRLSSPRSERFPSNNERSSSSAERASPSSTLAAQVAMLDAARSALAGEAFTEALRLAEQYRTDFPNGELSPEAEVVAIEALVARGARAAATERAARFLARYPGDPHAARVKWLVR